MNGKISDDFNTPPFVLRFSKDERRVFQQNPYFSFDWSASSALCTNSRRSFFSASGGSLASPVTCTMPLPKTTRFEPTILAMGRAEVI